MSVGSFKLTFPQCYQNIYADDVEEGLLLSAPDASSVS